jgi:hypothetical protein
VETSQEKVGWVKAHRLYSILILYAVIANVVRVTTPNPSSAITKWIAYSGFLSICMIWFFLAAQVARAAIALYGSGSNYLAETPAWKIIFQLIVSYLLAIFSFAILYFDLSVWDANTFGERLTFPSALYFSVVAITSTGFGDIVPCKLPSCDGAKLLVSAELLFGFFYTVLFFSILAGLARRGTEIPGNRTASGSGHPD